MVRALLLAFGFFILSTHSAIAAERQVALELILAVDTSSSVDATEFELQRRGIADAFAHPDLTAVIEGMGNVGIAVMVMEWSGNAQQKKVVDWSLLNSRASSLAFSQRIRETPRGLSGSTDIGSALAYSIRELETNGFRGNRRVIDVSGDGRSSRDTSAAKRDRAVLMGVTINGLVIFNDEVGVGAIEEVDLVRHYSNKVIGGNGAFLMTATGFEDFRNAILRKLIREILGPGTTQLNLLHHLDSPLAK